MVGLARSRVSLQRCFCRPAVLSMLVLMEGSVGQLNLQWVIYKLEMGGRLGGGPWRGKVKLLLTE